ncbi:MAG TPA: FAD-dependent oxidoreductase [Ktedonobacterales bacterium]|nr:FAD-dependent oxidoreductase [Ktedonobacterales bacterium]
MATTQRASASPTPDASWLSPAELRLLEAICDTLIPVVQAPEGVADPHGLFARAAHHLDVAPQIAALLAVEDPETRAGFHQLLGLLQGPLFGVLLGGLPRGFMALGPAQREAALRAMATSRIARLREGFQVLKRLTGFIFYAAPDASGTNPNWPALRYTPAPPPPAAEAAPRRIQPLPVTGDLTLSADAVIVGSGAGGGMMAAELAAAGKEVIVLEKGGYYSEADFTGREAEMMPLLYLRRGLLSTADHGMVVLAGSCLGGGTVVNWSTSLRTPPDVLEEWEREHGLAGASGAEFARGFAVAETRMGVNTADSEPNANNAALERGCQALGYASARIPRNAADCQQRCGACGFGCPYGRKQSTLLTFLQDAHQRGARIVVRATVERVLIEAGRAVGVEGWVADPATGARHRLVVRAAAVVVAGGAIESPALLLRSGLKNPNIGRHLRLHPVSSLAGYYAEPIASWQGSLQTVYSEQFARLRGGHGLRFELVPAHPGLLGLVTPWDGGMAHKRQMLRAPYAASFIALTRDTGEGSISLNQQGDPILHYWPNAVDQGLLVRGIQELARIAVAGGAVAVASLHTPLLQLEAEGGRPGAVSAARLNDFARAVERHGIAVNRVLLGTAHQMGTCRLGQDARGAVADPQGAVYGVRGLFVADASTFPTASGVNPMLTTMAMAYRVAQTVKQHC